MQAGEPVKASVTTSSISEPAAIPKPNGTKCRIISVSSKYLTLELEEPTNLQNGQQVVVSRA